MAVATPDIMVIKFSATRSAASSARVLPVTEINTSPRPTRSPSTGVHRELEVAGRRADRRDGVGGYGHASDGARLPDDECAMCGIADRNRCVRRDIEPGTRTRRQHAAAAKIFIQRLSNDQGQCIHVKSRSRLRASAISASLV